METIDGTCPVIVDGDVAYTSYRRAGGATEQFRYVDRSRTGAGSSVHVWRTQGWVRVCAAPAEPFETVESAVKAAYAMLHG